MKQARLAVRLPESLLEEAKVLAARKNRTVSTLIRMLLKQAIKKDKGKRGVTPTFDAEQG